MSNKVICFLALALPQLQTIAASPIQDSSVSQNSTVGERDSYVMQINYYWDSGCSDFATSLSIAYGLDGVCLNYYYSGTQSANVADCAATFCQAGFYSMGCGMYGWDSSYMDLAENPDQGSGNCVQANGDVFNSVVTQSYFNTWYGLQTRNL